MLLRDPVIRWVVGISTIVVAGVVAYVELRYGERSHIAFTRDREDGREREQDAEGIGIEGEKQGGDLV